MEVYHITGGFVKGGWRVFEESLEVKVGLGVDSTQFERLRLASERSEV